MDLNDEGLAVAAPGPWRHATVSFPGGQGITGEAAAVLLKLLDGEPFWFLRKQGQLRLRTMAFSASLLDRLVDIGLATAWTAGIYEPETEAFGGPEGMAVAHDLFCADSPAALADTGRDGNRERCVLLISTLLGGAGLDRFEIGDVWAKLGAERPQLLVDQLPAGEQRTAAVAAVRRLMHVDAAKAYDHDPVWAARVESYREAGARLAVLAADGLLTRGLRATLAHHLIFALNRAAIDTTEQAATAWLAQEVAFRDDKAVIVSTSRSGGAAPRVGQMETTLTPDTDPAELRAALVAQLTDENWLRSPENIEAFRAVERHQFVPEVDVKTAYINDAVSVKTNSDGVMISCISQPGVIATQLEQMQVRPGHRIFEAGAATGYNAALLAYLTGPAGHVWTVDVDEDLVDGAKAHLAAAGVSNVTVLLADGAAGLPSAAPFDRVQFTVGTADLPVALLDQLTPDGRIVFPMRIRGSISRSFALERDDDFWKAVSHEMATFVPLRKGIQDDDQTALVFDGPGDVYLELFPEQIVDRDRLRTVLGDPAHRVWTDVKIRKLFAWEWLYLYLAASLPNGLSRMPGKAPDFTPHFSWGSMAALEDDSLAYLSIREDDDEIGHYWQIGVVGHGHAGEQLTGRVVDLIHAWDRRGGNDASQPTFRMAVGDARGHLDIGPASFVIDKPLSRIAIDWE